MRKRKIINNDLNWNDYIETPIKYQNFAINGKIKTAWGRATCLPLSVQNNKAGRGQKGQPCQNKRDIIGFG